MKVESYARQVPHVNLVGRRRRTTAVLLSGRRPLCLLKNESLKMKTTLYGRVWARFQNSPNDTAMLLKHPGKAGELVQLNWRTLGHAVGMIMSYLQSIGFKKGDRAAILAWNCPEWVFADLAIQSLGGVTVSIYPNCSAEQVNYVIKDSGSTVLFGNDAEQLSKVEDSCRTVHFDKIPVELGLLDDGGNPRKLQERFALDPSFGAFGATCVAPTPLVVEDVDQLATIIYSSGSTGIPKGCMISHGNIVGALVALHEAGFDMNPNTDVYLSYLPLAHVYERINGAALSLWRGVPLGFSDLDNMKHDVRLFKPTMLCGVPAVWRKIKAGIDDPKDALPAFLNKHGLWQQLLNWALNQKSGWTKLIADRVVLDKIRAKMGGRLKLLMSGGAPISSELLEFYNKLGLELLEGYGATETTGGIATNRPAASPGKGPKNKIGSVGKLVPGAEVRLVAEEGEEASGLGEIWLRGPQVFRGYWNLPELTAAALTPDNWYKTGDLGKIDSDGFLYINGRKDGMYKTDGGKYVAKEKVEKAFETSSIVQFVVPIAQGRKFVSALVFVNTATARTLVGKDVPAGQDATAFYSQQPEVAAAVDKAVASANVKLERWEQVKKVVILSVEASVDNGLLTPTQKIRSKEAHKRFAAEIESIYAGL